MNRREFIVQGVAGLAWVVFAPPGPFDRLRAAGGAGRIAVRGRVWARGTGQPLSGVAVSNGFEFAVTDAAGSYRIQVDAATYPFVFVTAPAGYRPAATHYRRVAAAAVPQADVDFELAADSSRLGGRLRLAHVSDSHIGVAAKPNFASDLDLAADYRAIVADAAPDLILNGGDLTDAGRREDFEACLAVARPLRVPVAHAYGNHDSDADHIDFGRTELTNNLRFQAVVGPDQFAFDWGDYHIIVCGMYWPGMPFRVPRMSAWFRAALALQPPEKKLILLTHDKPREYPQLTESWAPSLPEFRRHPGAILALHGHHHTTCVFRHGPLTVVGVPTVCFGGIDTSPRGYALIQLDRGQVDVELRQLGGRPAAIRRQEDAAPDLPGASARWSRQLSTNLHRAAPVVAGDRVLLCLGENRPLTDVGVVALGRDSGREIWTLRTAAAIKNAVALSEPGAEALAGSAYAVEVTGRLHRFAVATGRREWEVTLPYFPDRYIYATPRATRDAVYVTQHQGSCAVAPADGKMLWRTGPEWDENRSSIHQLPGLDETRLFFLTTTFMGLHAVSAQRRSDGQVLWTRRLDGLPPGYPKHYFQSHFPSPVIAGELLVVPGLFDRLAVLDRETGEPRWHEPVLARDGPMSGAKASWYYTLYEHAHGLIVRGDTIYATTSNGCAYAIDLLSGRRRWSFATARAPRLDFQPYHRGRGNILTEPAAWRDRLLLGGADGWLYVLSAGGGRLLAEVDFGSPITAPPVVAGDDLFVATFDGRCTCYRLSSAATAT